MLSYAHVTRFLSMALTWWFLNFTAHWNNLGTLKNIDARLLPHPHILTE